jgi:protein translocase SecG subunit
MEKILIIAQIFISILLTVSILFQNRGAGLSSTFGGDFGGYYTKRGFEKFLFWASIVLGTLFVGISAAIFYITSQGIS